MLRAFADLHARPSWQERCEELIVYRQVHGDCNVPKAHGPLGRWVARQRELAKKHVLPRDRRDRLDELGFVWNTNDAAWAARYDSLREWARVNGHACVPIASGDLGLWVAKQRQLRRKGKLAEDRREALDALAFVWDTAAAEWEEKFAALLDWKAAHEGDTRVPFNSPAGDGLGWWVATQRQVRRKGKMGAERQRRLDDIGFVWNPTETPRQRRFSTSGTERRGGAIGGGGGGGGGGGLASAALARTRSAHVGAASPNTASYHAHAPHTTSPTHVPLPPPSFDRAYHEPNGQDHRRGRHQQRNLLPSHHPHPHHHQNPFPSIHSPAPPTRTVDGLFRTRSAHVPAGPQQSGQDMRLPAFHHRASTRGGPNPPHLDPAPSLPTRTRSVHNVGALALAPFRSRTARRDAAAQLHSRSSRPVPDADAADTLRHTRSAHVPSSVGGGVGVVGVVGAGGRVSAGGGGSASGGSGGSGGGTLHARRHRTSRAFPSSGLLGGAASVLSDPSNPDFGNGGLRSPTPPRSASPGSGSSLPGMHAPRRTSAGSKRSYDEAAGLTRTFRAASADSALAPQPESKRHHSFTREPSSAGAAFSSSSAQPDYAASETGTEWGQLPGRRTASFGRFSPRATSLTPPGSVDALGLPPLSGGSGTSTPSGSVRTFSGHGYSPSSSPHPGQVMLAPLLVPGEDDRGHYKQTPVPSTAGRATPISGPSKPTNALAGSLAAPAPLLPPVSSLSAAPQYTLPEGHVGPSGSSWPVQNAPPPREYDWSGEQDEYSGVGPRRIISEDNVSREPIEYGVHNNSRHFPAGTSWPSLGQPTQPEASRGEGDTNVRQESGEGSEASAIANLAQLAVSGRGAQYEEDPLSGGNTARIGTRPW